NWQGNNISVTWYNGDTEYDSNQCTYGGELDVPTAPTKTGYTFKGWRVRQADTSCFASQVCSLTGSGVNGLTYSGSNSTYGYYSHNGQNKANESTYGLTAGGWAVKDTSGGIVKGIASCNSTKPNLWDTVMEGMNNGTMTEEQFMNTLWGTCNTDTFRPSNTFNATASGQYCWCKMESYTPSGGSACNIASPSWVFGSVYESASNCAFYCALYCANSVVNIADFRRAVFGVTQ
ncbi:MAG: InlB B-repeat-containing protein, partial [Alphaproteobacteria bacterium]